MPPVAGSGNSTMLGAAAAPDAAARTTMSDRHSAQSERIGTSFAQ